MTDLIPITQISPNPFQPRQAEDPEHILKVAQSIADKGLLQIPIGRQVDGHVELAFGHTRLAAYKLLHGQGSLGYGAMPVDVRKLNDQEMFELAVSENLARKDLTPMEEARAMLTYREKFGKTSAEIGKLFGLSESAVRNKMRLVELPEAAQNALAAGQISEGNARMLLSLAKVQPDQVEAIAKELADETLTPESAANKVQRAINTKIAVCMWSKWQHNAPCGGGGLWPLDWKAGKVSLSWPEFQKVYDGPKYNDTTKTLFEGATYWIIDGHYDREKLIETGTPEPIANLVWSLMFPPACTACEHHAAIDGSHYCGVKACWKRKKQAWMKAEIERLAGEFGVEEYSETRDGKYYAIGGSTKYVNGKVIDSTEQFKAWLAHKDPDLRLRSDYNEYREWNMTGSQVVQLISVHPTIVKELMADEAKEANRNAERERSMENSKNDDENRGRSRHYIDQEAVWLFTYPFKTLSLPVLESLARTISRVDQKLDQDCLCRLIAERLITPDWNVLAQGPLAVAEHLKHLAITWGLSEPWGGWDEWVERARKFEVESHE